MNSKTCLWTTLVFSSLLVGVPALCEEAESSPPVAAGKIPGSPDAGAAGATRAHRNPDTGQIEFGPAVPISAQGLSARERNMLDRSSDDLQQRTLASGAVAVNLQGRFQSMATIHVHGDTNELHLSCSIDDGASQDHAVAPALAD